MAIREEFLGHIVEGLDERIAGQDARPGVEIWPEEDDFGRWVAAHRDPVRTIICGTPEFGDAPFCGRGIH